MSDGKAREQDCKPFVHRNVPGEGWAPFWDRVNREIRRPMKDGKWIRLVVIWDPDA